MISLLHAVFKVSAAVMSIFLDCCCPELYHSQVWRWLKHNHIVHSLCTIDKVEKYEAILSKVAVVEVDAESAPSL